LRDLCENARMELGIVLPNSGSLATPEAMYAIAERSEALGFDATADHLVLPRTSSASYPYVRGRDVRLDPSHPFIEPLMALAGVAARTRRIRLGVSVYLAALRHPLVSAKLVASLDQISGGRAILGVGAGWIPEEYATFGIEWRERGAVLDEHIECLRTLWSDSTPHYEGTYYRFGDLGFEPKPVHGQVPIWVGGNSGPAMRRAARLGDGWHCIDLSPGELQEATSRLRAHCEAQERDPGEVVVSMRAQLTLTERHIPADRRPGPLTGPLDEVVSDLARLRELGVGHMALWPSAGAIELADYLERIERIATDVVPALA
jgi:probable F420-dependent oxidoreductase